MRLRVVIAASGNDNVEMNGFDGFSICHIGAVGSIPIRETLRSGLICIEQVADTGVSVRGIVEFDSLVREVTDFAIKSAEEGDGFGGEGLLGIELGETELGVKDDELVFGNALDSRIWNGRERRQGQVVEGLGTRRSDVGRVGRIGTNDVGGVGSCDSRGGTSVNRVGMRRNVRSNSGGFVERKGGKNRRISY